VTVLEQEGPSGNSAGCVCPKGQWLISFAGEGIDRLTELPHASIQLARSTHDRAAELHNLAAHAHSAAKD